MQLSVSLRGSSPSRWWHSFWLSCVWRLRSNRAVVALKQFACGYVGHARSTVVWENDRISLFCRDCGFESSGVESHTTRVRHLHMRERQRLKWELHQRRWTWLKTG